MPILKIVEEAGKYLVQDENGFTYSTQDTEEQAQRELEAWNEYYQN
jgi:hypothetical protein